MRSSIFKLVFLLCCITSTTLFAQRGGQMSLEDMEQRIEEKAVALQSKLQLDDLQTALLKANLKEYGQKQLTIIQSDEARDIKKEKMGSLRKEQHNALATFLDEQQLEQFEELAKKERKRRRKGFGNRRTPQK